MRASVLVLNACQNSQSDSCFIAFRFFVKLRPFNSVHLGSLNLFFKQQYLPKVSLQGKGAIRAAWFCWKRKSSLFCRLLSVLLTKSPLDDISSHQAISGLSRHGALTVPGSNPPPTPLISSSEALVRNINVSILSWPNAPNRSRITTALRGWDKTIIGRKCLFPSLISSTVSN